MHEKRSDSHFQQLFKISVDREKQHVDGVPVTVLNSLIPRSDGLSVFEEGEGFSGIERIGDAEACLTITASPHVAPTLPKERLLTAAEQVLGKPIVLPESMQAVARVSPQLILWWQEAGGQAGSTDMLRLSTLLQEQRRDFCQVMANQTERAILIINNATQKPTIWGSWGNGTLEERSQDGKSRGVPTNKFGHLHITHINPHEQDVSLQNEVSATERLNHYGPWNVLLLSELNVPIKRALGSITSNYFQSSDSITINHISEFIKKSNGTTSSNYGYELAFSHTRSFKEVYGLLIEISGNFEDFYKRLNQQYEEYHKNQSNFGLIREIKGRIADESKKFGFTDEEANGLISFILDIKPTYGQLSRWEKELSESQEKPDTNLDLERIREEKERYEHLLLKMGDDREKDTLRIALVRDTLTPPQQYKLIERTWPVHASSAFVIDDYELSGGKAAINRLKLFPGIAGSEACVERVVGTVIKRSLSY